MLLATCEKDGREKGNLREGDDVETKEATILLEHSSFVLRGEMLSKRTRERQDVSKKFPNYNCTRNICTFRKDRKTITR